MIARSHRPDDCVDEAQAVEMDETRPEERLVMAMVVAACFLGRSCAVPLVPPCTSSTLVRRSRRYISAELVGEQDFDEVLGSGLQRCRRGSEPSVQRGTTVTGQAPHLASTWPLRSTDRLDQNHCGEAPAARGRAAHR